MANLKMKLKTFDEWKSKGRVVVKGSKGVRKNKKGKWAFSYDQTTEFLSRKKMNNQWSRDYAEQEYYDDLYYPLTAFDLGADF